MGVKMTVVEQSRRRTRSLTRLAALLAAAALTMAGLGVAAPARAGTGGSQTCEDGALGSSDDVPIAGGPNSILANTPFVLGLEVNGDNGGVHVAVCYSTSGYGDSGSEITGENLSVGVNDGPNYSNPSANTVNVGCMPDTNSPQGVYLACGVGLRTTITAGGAGGGQEFTFAVPFAVCLGSCIGGNVFPTGVIVGSITAGTDGVNLSGVTVYIDGIPVSVGSTGAAASGGGVAAGPGGAGIPVCIGSLPCVTVPLGAYARSNGPVATITMNGLPVPVGLPPGCIVSVNDPGCP
jgi:hypothetical protein